MPLIDATCPVILMLLLCIDFLEKNPNMKVSYELYRNIIKKDMNISFAQLRNEECEICEGNKIHQPTCENTESCEECQAFRSHKEKYESARIHYQRDVYTSQNEENATKAFF